MFCYNILYKTQNVVNIFTVISRRLYVNRRKGELNLSNPITVDVDFNVNVSKLEQAKSTLTELKAEAQQIPAIGDTMTQGIENALSTVDLLQQKIERAEKAGSDAEKASLQSFVKSGISDLDIVSQLFGKGGTFDLQEGKSFMTSLSDIVQNELKQVTPALRNLIRTF